jgi:hypothetical protein
VILWPDTFNNHFHPDVAKAATRFLERAGWRVIVPRAALCCGRPLYDYGMLDTARRWLEEIVAELRGEIRAGIPMVGLEPSCVATFRDELVSLLPHDEDAQRLARQTFLLSEFIDQKMPDDPLPQLRRRAIVAGTLPSQGDHEDDRRGARAAEDGDRLRGARLRLLRDGGRVRIREGALRRFDRLRGAGAAPARPAGGRRRARDCEWL